jgi:hypothetical protein
MKEVTKEGIQHTKARLSASGKKNGKAKYNMESILELKTENL